MDDRYEALCGITEEELYSVFDEQITLNLLAKKIEGEPSQRIASMDITALRNAYGRQLGSSAQAVSV